MSWEPIGHRPPIPRIETSPRYTPAPQTLPHHVQEQLDKLEQIKRQVEAERLWPLVVQAASGGGPTTQRSYADMADSATTFDPEEQFDHDIDAQGAP